jgi:hypothetical protein
MVFIDGVRQIPDMRLGADGSQVFHPSRGRVAFNESPEVEMLSRINPSDIEMIEVFRGVGQIPGVFHWNGCAVVAIWLKWNR